MSEIERYSLNASEDFSSPELNKHDIGWILVGSGAVGSFVAFLRGWRSPLALAVPLSVVGLGFGIILARRRTRIEAAEEGIRAELDALDPIARAQVLKAVVEEQVGRLSGVGRRD